MLKIQVLKCGLLLFGPILIASCGLADRSQTKALEANDESKIDTNTLTVELQPRSGVSGRQRINFAVPLLPGQLKDAALVQVLHNDVELPTARHSLALYPDGSIRSVQIQFELEISEKTSVIVHIGKAPGTPDITAIPVADTLVESNGAEIPRVWATLPGSWLSASGALGPLVTSESVRGTPFEAWDKLCDYAKYDVDAFQAKSSTADVWLYDRGTVMYRGYARTGNIGPLTSAYRETSIYRSGIRGSGSSLTIAVPGKSKDLKYYYAQNMAIHYLLTGDERYRESAEDIATSINLLWKPRYSGGFWTERHAGFQLLANVWAALVSDDKAAEFTERANEDVDAFLALQNSNDYGNSQPDARCFAHTAASHDEEYGYPGCSPWMSAILADGLDAYATELGGSRAAAVRDSIVKLGRVIAQRGRDANGKPYYWMGMDKKRGEVDPYNEHWGESAYVVAMAWHHGGKQDAGLEKVARELVQGFSNQGEVGQLRSFNWQCRSAVATPYFLK
ncbi:hypothetical protein [Oligoflexus tunisiensis]|uniref:hypothetical protein n=1 Tax=Oligoflexus tunisiensis TaxID=708132 RepID=UPI00114D15E2|nr:hypothetical protein [Oligoflexus tunisiensis]